jgi:hypothetical protein
LLHADDDVLLIREITPAGSFGFILPLLGYSRINRITQNKKTFQKPAVFYFTCKEKAPAASEGRQL